MGYKAKTDQIDARDLLHMTEVINQHPEGEDTFALYLTLTGNTWPQ